jgi:hypothetical protein
MNLILNIPICFRCCLIKRHEDGIKKREEKKTQAVNNFISWRGKTKWAVKNKMVFPQRDNAAPSGVFLQRVVEESKRMSCSCCDLFRWWWWWMEDFHALFSAVCDTWGTDSTASWVPGTWVPRPYMITLTLVVIFLLDK